MRDDYVSIYRRSHPSIGGNVERWYVEKQMTGIYLCDTNDGTGANAPSWKPWPRFGNASRGFCKSQIHVNDAK
jgi:hypothetical protein